RKEKPLLERLEERTMPAVTIANGAGLGYAGIADGSDPPDTCGAAGPNSYIEATNGTIRIFAPKATGTTLATPRISDVFYNPAIGNETKITPNCFGVADSTILFDNLMGGDGRFIIGEIDVDNRPGVNVSQYIFAVSTSSNPTTLTAADWKFYHITTTEGPAGNTSFTDYPGNFGFNADAVVETFNMAQGNFLNGNAQILSINASDLAAGVPNASLRFFQNDFSGTFNYRPTAMHDSVAGDPMWLIRNPNDGTNINVTQMTNVLSNAAVFTTTSLALPAGATFATGNLNPLNPNGSTIRDIDTRILKAGEFNNTIVATNKVRISGNEADVEWYAIDVSGATPAFQLVGGVANVGRVGFGANTYTFDPGIDINSRGDIGLTFNESDRVGGAANAATGGFVSTFVPARRPTDAAGTMQASVLVPAGTGFGNINDRVGDFSGLTYDPVNGTFWAVNEFGNNGNGATAVAEFMPLPPG